MHRLTIVLHSLVAKFKGTAMRSPVAQRSASEINVRENAIVLLSCVKSKRAYRCKAADMYTSPLFRKMMAYALRLKPKGVYILSAKYGLLRPDDIIDPYEQTLKKMSARERQQWARTVISKLREQCDLEADHFVVLAGSAYRENLVPHVRHYKVPMAGLSFGKQLQWLERQLQ
jgi:cytoplasmic iron level regulating protein YaaA (DUF328/UPF0246 family)